MNKRIKILVLLLLIIPMFIGCGVINKNADKNNNDGENEDQINQDDNKDEENNGQNNENDKEDEKDTITELIKTMTLDEKIGQMVILGFEGDSLNEDVKSLINQYKVGGFILFKRNVENSNQLLSLLNSLKETNSDNKIPLFLAVDEEGGKVSRMPDELIDLPNSNVVGESKNNEFAINLGRILGQQLQSFGFNLDFAPVLDVNSNPNNPVIGVRSLSSNPQVVGELGVEIMNGIKEKGIIPVVKHFPGHGDTSVDSHLGLPKVNKDLSSLRQLELIPFKEAIENDVDTIMIAHILFPELDPNYPASLSERLVTDLLRKEMGYKGVVITDDLTMGAIKDNYSINDAAVKAILAGGDIVLVCHEYENEITAIDSLKEAVVNGIITEERIDESVYRILKLKNKYKLEDRPVVSVDIETINNNINKLLNTYMK
ncbi:beta-N-acetylhexosaminidase [Sporosalibacterium faouarense]|uniref:beta-N-acetylhexosaminidase n=1 Tax=Sporosalibacterium faouarense TaxID=516123 RepID=UPI00192C54AC|nr:beta-N-acetylhexosaminidase [Sporosalibacterium faouarense]